MSCLDTVQVSLDMNCGHQVMVAEILEDPSNCPGNKELTIFNPNGTVLSGNPMVNSTHLGQYFDVRVRDIASNNFCMSVILVQDTTRPVVNCGTTNVSCTSDITPIITGTPTATDNCDGNVTLSWSDILTIPNGCTSPYVKIIKRLWVGIDDWNNTDTCVQTIYVERPSLIDVVFPGNYDGLENPPLNCSNANTDPAHTGQPTIDGQPIVDMCDMIVTSTDQIVTICDNGYAVYRTWKVIDECSGQMAIDIQIIKIISTLASVVFPPNYDGVDQPVLSCQNPDTSPAATGSPSIDGVAINGYCNLLVTHTDQIVPICYNSYKILRIWVVIDGCNGLSTNHIQVIKVADKIAPELVCPPDITIGTNATTCFASYTIPDPVSITDNCSDAAHISMTVSGPGTALGNTFINIPLGVHQIQYVATDGCGNTGYCSFALTVIDDDLPFAVCDENTVTALQADGISIASAQVFDDGSYDNCGVSLFEVRRMDGNLPFSNQVIFDCDDDVVMVTLRVHDFSGNYSDCMVEVDVQDKLPPVILCPADITLDCGADYNNLSLTGNAIAIDNCGFELNYSTDNNLDNCNQGFYIRTWTATDLEGNISECSQYINMHNYDVFDESHIIWPPDYEVFECGASLHPNVLPAPYDSPVIYSNSCSNVEVAYEDLYFEIAPPACFKIVRTWTVVDWCQSDVPGAGVWTHGQVLKVHDNTAPVLVCPASLTVENNTSSCSTTVSIPDITVTDCSNELMTFYEVDQNFDGIIDFTGNSLNASGTYESGVYGIRFSVEDNCSNISYCNFTLAVNDIKKPAVACKFGVGAELSEFDSDANGTPDTQLIQVLDTELVQSVSDNCTPVGQLRLRVRRSGTGTGVPAAHVVTFTCNDIGPQPVEVWVGDNADNWDYCETFVQVQDNMGICGVTAASAVISGTVANVANAPVEAVSVSLSGVNMPPVMSGIDGQFQFVGVPLYGDYTLTPQRNDDMLNGVTTYDIVLITKHILGLAPLNSPYRLLAADVNRSGGITAFDLVQLRQMILGVLPAFPNNTSWRFIRSNYTFINPVNPFMEDLPEVASIAYLSSDQQVGFTAFKTGDVNDSASPGFWTGEEDRSGSPEVSLLLPDMMIKAGTTFAVPVRATTSDIGAFQFTLNFDPDRLQWEDTRSGQLTVTGDQYAVFEDKGALTMSWNTAGAVAPNDRDAWFSWVFTAKEDLTLSEALTLNSRITTAVAYTGSGEAMNMSIVFGAGADPVESTAFELYQNEPNPASGDTKIGFHLPAYTNATLRVFDAGGQLIRQISGTYEKGYSEIVLSKADFPAAGVYFYQLETPSSTATKRMVILD